MREEWWRRIYLFIFLFFLFQHLPLDHFRIFFPPRKDAWTEENPSAHSYRGVKGEFKILNWTTYKAFFPRNVKKLCLCQKVWAQQLNRWFFAQRFAWAQMFVLIDALNRTKAGVLCSCGFVTKWNWLRSFWLIALEQLVLDECSSTLVRAAVSFRLFL